MESIYVDLGTDLVQVVQLMRLPVLDAFFAWITRFGEAPALLLGAILVVASWRKGWLVGVGMLLAFLVASFVNAELKDALDVARPSADDVYTFKDASGSATPSAHTMSAAAVWLFLALSLRRTTQLWLAVAALPLVVGFSRVYLGMHYPGDVVLGLALGAGIALLLHLAVAWTPVAARRSALQPSSRIAT